MAVLDNLRKLSTMEFYKNAKKIRWELTDWLFRDFGNKHNPRSVRQVIKNIDEEDQAVIDEIFQKYGKSTNKEFQSEYPQWFIDHERDIVVRLLQELMECIIKANSIKIETESEYQLRRQYQTRAISACFALYTELDYIAASIGTDLNDLVDILDRLDREISLLRGWRQSDNKKRPKTK